VELSVTLQPSDKISVLPIGRVGGEPVVSIAPPGGTSYLVLFGSSRDLRRLADALSRAAGGEETS
jgi:hypothetical protein